jgi:hypothetical protein
MPDGGFMGVAKTKMNKIAKKRSDYGRKPNHARLDPNAHDKFAASIELRPFDVLHDCQLVSVWCLVSQLFFRGSDDIAYAKWEQFFITHIAEGINKGLIRVQAQIDLDKMMKMSLECALVRDQHAQVFDVIEDRNNPNCPAHAFWQLRQWCLPEQERVFCGAAEPKLMDAYKAVGLPYRTNPNRPIGKNKLAGAVKKLHERTGCIAPPAVRCPTMVDEPTVLNVWRTKVLMRKKIWQQHDTEAPSSMLIIILFPL